MPKSLRARARFTPVDLGQHFKNLSGYERDAPPVNRVMHRYTHKPKKLLFTSASTLDTTIQPAFYPTWNARVSFVALSVVTAPTTTLTCDVLLNGASMFSGKTDGAAESLPTIPAGQNWGYKYPPTVSRWSADNQDFIQVQVTAVGGAGGPLTAIFYFFEGLGGRV